MAQVNNEQVGDGHHITYNIPQGGLLVWAGNTVLLKDTSYPQQGYTLIDYLLHPEIIARTSNYVGCPDSNQAALPLVGRKLRGNLVVYLSEETIVTLFSLETLSLKVERIHTQVWSRVEARS